MALCRIRIRLPAPNRKRPYDERKHTIAEARRPQPVESVTRIICTWVVPSTDGWLYETIFERSRLNFIRTDLQVCLASIAATEFDLGNREHAARTIASAEKGYTTLLRFFSQAKALTPEEGKELQLTFGQRTLGDTFRVSVNIIHTNDSPKRKCTYVRMRISFQ